MKADNFLEEKGLEFELVVQDNPTLDCDDAARERGVETSQIAKSLIVERDGENFHCVISGDRTLSAGKFGEHRLVDPDVSRELTGQESGTVHPFSTEIKHFVDRRLLEEESISFTTGDSQEGVIIDTESFRKALNSADFSFKIGDYVEYTEEDLKELEKEGVSEEEARFVASNALNQVFFSLAENSDSGLVIGVLEEFKRHELEIKKDVAERILDRAEKETHMQKLVQAYAENGKLPKEDDYSLEEAVEQVLDENQDALDDYISGKDSALNYLLGQVMKNTNGQADGGEARKALQEKIGG